MADETTTNETPLILRLGDVKEDGSPDIAKVLFTLPVPHRQMHVRQKVRIDKQQVKGRSGSIKQAKGYEDATISVDVQLVERYEPPLLEPVSALEQLKRIQKAFKDQSQKTYLPKVFSIMSPLTDTLGIRTVLFEEFPVKDTPGSDKIELTLKFVEFENIVQTRKEQNRVKTSTSSEEEATTPNPYPETDDDDDEASLESEREFDNEQDLRAFQIEQLRKDVEESKKQQERYEKRAAYFADPWRIGRPSDLPTK